MSCSIGYEYHTGDRGIHGIYISLRNDLRYGVLLLPDLRPSVRKTFDPSAWREHELERPVS
jgi:hypothetical protein